MSSHAGDADCGQRDEASGDGGFDGDDRPSVTAKPM
jgi:hypothetical protein